MSKNDLQEHQALCDLRTEICPNGCSVKIRVTNMEKHLLTCPLAAVSRNVSFNVNGKDSINEVNIPELDEQENSFDQEV